MQFSGTLYPYQEEILKVFESEKEKGEKKIHIVAPPGSGKTIIGLEMMCRLDVPTLILVPNLTLQEQWKDKLIKLFLNDNRVEGEEFISTTIQEIKKINIITYQSLSSTGEDMDFIREEIYNTWFEAEKENFSSKSLFTSFINELREENLEEYEEQYSIHRKTLRKSGESSITRGMMKESIKDYIQKLRAYGVACMIVDEAHHLTSWWSHVLYEIWRDLDSPYIIGLTATPPFENSDYFELDESYTKLLGNVDYYTPTPAIVKSGRLAPYSDLVYFVQPDENLEKILKEKEIKLEEFITIHKAVIIQFLDIYIRENFETLKVKSLPVLEKYMRFIYAYKGSDIDMSQYITKNASLPVSLDDIAKSVGKWGMSTLKKSKSSTILDEIKTLFFDIGYIWRNGNLYRFETPIEKGLLYAKSKINGIRAVIEQEKKNLGNNLRCVIICDFLDSESDWINGHYIFDSISAGFPNENIHLVSGQGIWGNISGSKQEIDDSILGITEKFSKGDIQILIGTRGILGEGWDCPRVNTLIDVTGVSAYMSVNQIHGRAIRLDLSNPKKVANIYDIVCLGNGYQGLRDFERLSKKHAQFYGVDESGLIIKELDHIYPQLERNLKKSEEINAYTLKKSELRDMVYELWGIGGEFRNEEIFSLSLNITNPYSFVPLPGSLSIKKFIKLRLGNWKTENLMNFGDSTYHELIRIWICELIDGVIRVLQYEGKIDDNFSYSLHHTRSGSITITAKTLNILKGKEFIEILSGLFGPVTDEKYKHSQWSGPQLLDMIKLPLKISNDSYNVSYIILGVVFIVYVSPLIFTIFNSFIILLFWIFGGVIAITLWTNKILNIQKKWISIRKELEENTYAIDLGLPHIIASNELKRRIFSGNIPKSFFQIKGPLENKKKISVITFMMFYGFIFMAGTHWFIPEIGLVIVGLIINCILSIISYFILNNFLNFCLSLPRRIRYRNIKEMNGSILPIEPSDVGTQKFISAKVEKLWI